MTDEGDDSQRRLSRYGNLLLEVPLERENTEAEVVVRQSLEETDREVKVGILAASGAGISNDGVLGVAVALVGDYNSLAAVLRALASVTILAVVEGNEGGVIRVDGTASTSNSVLGEPGTTRKGHVNQGGKRYQVEILTFQ